MFSPGDDGSPISDCRPLPHAHRVTRIECLALRLCCSPWRSDSSVIRGEDHPCPCCLLYLGDVNLYQYLYLFEIACRERVNAVGSNPELQPMYSNYQNHFDLLGTEMIGAENFEVYHRFIRLPSASSTICSLPPHVQHWLLNLSFFWAGTSIRIWKYFGWQQT